MPAKNKIKTFYIKINKSRQTSPSPFLIDLKKSSAPDVAPFLLQTEELQKPDLWQKQVRENSAALWRSFADRFNQLYPLLHQGFKSGLTSTKKFFKTLPRPTLAASFSKMRKTILKVRHHKKQARTKKQYLHPQYWLNKIKLCQEPSEGWHHLVADLVGLAVLLLVIFLPLQIIFAYGRAKQSEATLQTLTTSLKGNLAWAQTAAQNGELGDLQEAAQNIGQNFHQLQATLKKTWPLTLYPPLHSLNHLLGTGQNLGNEISAILGQVGEMENHTLSPAQGLLGINNDLNEILPQVKTARKDLQKVSRGWLIPQQIKNYAAALDANLSVWQNQGEYISQTLSVLPDLLGQDQPKKYLILFQNNHEIRPTGGFIGSFAYLEVSQGKITKWEVPGGGSYDLQGYFKQRLAAPEPLTLINPRFEFQDLNWFPDFPTSAKKISDAYEQSGGQTLDGVFAVTATVAEKLLKISGPLLAQGKTIDSQNFFTTTQQAVEFDYDKTLNRPKQLIGDLFALMMTRLSLSQPKEIAQVIGLALESLQNKDIQVYSPKQEMEEQIKQLGWGGEIKQAPGDYLMVVSTNIAGGKTDGAVEQKINKETLVEADGRVISRVTVTRTHQGVPGDAWTGKRNVVYLRAYVPLHSKLLDSYGFEAPPAYLFETNDSLKLDPDIRQSELDATSKQNGTQVTQESGKTVFGNWLQLDPGQTQEAVFVYELPFRLSLNDKPSPYTLMVQRQAGRANDTFEHSFATTSDKAVSLREIDSAGNNPDLNSDKFFAFVIN